MFSCKGNCDHCGSPQRLDNVVGVVVAEYPNGWLLQITPFSCMGCHKVVDSYNVILPMEVSKELKNIKT